MERKIGEIFEHNGEWYQCVTGRYCDDCAFRNDNCEERERITLKEQLTKEETTGLCVAKLRSDCKSVIFKKLEKVGEPYPLYGHIVQRYVGVKFPVALTEKRFINCNEINNTIDIEVKQDKENTEDMEVNEKTITIPEGWEFDRIDESGNIVLKEKKKELPKTWLKCLRVVNETEYINDCSEIEKQCDADYLESGGYLIGSKERNLLPRGLGKPMLALCQLLVCRNAWWKQLGWKPDWTDNNMKYCINYTKNKKEKDFCQNVSRILAFPTSEVRDQFLDTFRDLIEEAKELL